MFLIFKDLKEICKDAKKELEKDIPGYKKIIKRIAETYFCAVVLSLIFVILKWLGIINWGWWSLLSPLWGLFIVYFIILWIIGCVAGGGGLCD